MEVKNHTLLWMYCLIILLVIAGCDSVTNPEEQKEDLATVDAVPFTGEPLTDSDLRSTLAEVKNATSVYHSVSTAEADGYVQTSPFVPGMGYHYVNAGLLDDTINPLSPEALVYQSHPVHEGKRKLVAVEYIIPFAIIDKESRSALDNEFPGVDGAKWHKEDDIDSWTLHAWIWYPNPEGMFHPTNPRIGDGS